MVIPGGQINNLQDFKQRLILLFLFQIDQITSHSQTHFILFQCKNVTPSKDEHHWERLGCQQDNIASWGKHKNQLQQCLASQHSDTMPPHGSRIVTQRLNTDYPSNPGQCISFPPISSTPQQLKTSTTQD